MVEHGCGVVSRVGLAAALVLTMVGVSPAGASVTPNDPSDDAATGVSCAAGASAVGTSGALPGGLVAESAYQAQLMARATGNAVEDVSQRTESSQVFATPDGMWMLSAYMGDNWVQTAGDGSSAADWSEIDLTLEVGADGLVRPSVYSGSLTLAPGGEKTDVVITSAMGDSGVTMKVLWDGSKLPVVVLDGARATYPEVWPGVDYVVDVTMSGFEQYFVLKTRAAAIARADDLFLPIEVIGGSLVEDQDSQGLMVLDASGSVVAIVPVAFAWDAVEDDTHLSPVLRPWSAEPHLSSGLKVAGLPESIQGQIEHVSKGSVEPQARKVRVSVSPHERGLRVGLEVDKEWLADPETDYPVIVDPEYAELDPQNATYDTYVRSASPTTNYGTETELRIGSTDGGSTVSRTYLTFDTSGIKDLEIETAKLSLWNYWSATCTPSLWYAYWMAPASSSTTWASPPGPRGSAFVSSTDTEGHTAETTPWCAEDWADITITTFAQAWVHRSEDTQGLFLTTGDETSLARWKRFYSLENASQNKPHIDYTYNRVPNTPTAVSIDGTPLTADLTLSPEQVADGVVVSVAVSDPDGEEVQAFFTVKQGGVVIVENLPGTKEASGGEDPSTATLPYTLASGVEYTIEVQVSDGKMMGEAYSPVYAFTGPASSGPGELSPDGDASTTAVTP